MSETTLLSTQPNTTYKTLRVRKIFLSTSNKMNQPLKEYKLKYFDFARLDNFIFDDEHIKIYNLINKLFFKTDINANEMIYDNSNIKVKLTIKNNADEANLVIETENNFSEKNEYILNMKKIISK